MNPLRYLGIVGIVILATAPSFIPIPSLAITAELAKKCRLMTTQAHPTQLPGRKNTGVEAAQREYFSKCIATDGKMDTAPNQNRPSTPSGAPPVTGGPPAIGAPTTVPAGK